MISPGYTHENPTSRPAALPTPFFSSDITFINTPGLGLADSIISDVRWAENLISYSFPDHGAPWSPHPYMGYGPGEEPWSPAYMPISPSNRSDFEQALRQWENIA